MQAPAPHELPARSAVYTGIFPCQKIREMVEKQEIVSEGIFAAGGILSDQIQPASIDLRLGDFAYRVDASFLPGKNVRVLEKLGQLDERYEEYKIDLRHGAILERGRLYVIPLLESIRLRSDVAAFANPKSSTGRLDILTRLIADEATVFDQVEEGYEGRLYLEVAPRSFSVVVRTGTRLNQLRFRRTRGELPRPITAADWKNLISNGEIADAPGRRG